MSYVVLARKYRPQSFKDVVGQDPVSQTLVNALESGRIAHAYIFSGPRGIGKTTTARILAKCLNCEKGPSIKPCDQCSSCTTIQDGSSVDDVLEIDGASNRGIEQIRELRESAKYTPTSSRYRIFIIDEAHQITKDAFGALLKILEEPPAHVIFMMATTEVQKIPAPILSRCQRFSLRPISSDQVFKHLKKICVDEKIKVEDSALTDIVKFVEGSLRDALSLLDQATVYANGTITSQTLRELLGLLPTEVIQGFAHVLTEGDPAAILKNTAQAIEEGTDLTQLGKDLQSYYHKLLLAKAGVENKSLAATAKLYDYPTLERNIRLLSKMLEEMRRSETPRALFEIYALRLAQKVLDPRIILERLEKLEKTPPVSPSLAPERPQPIPKITAAPKPEIVKETKKMNGPQAQAATQATMIKEQAPPSTWSESTVMAKWPEITHAISEQKLSLAAAMDEASVTFNNRGMVLTFGKSFNRDLVERSLGLISPHFQKEFGNSFQIETRFNAELMPVKKESPLLMPEKAAVPIEQPDDQFEEISPESASPEIKNILNHFSGTLKKEI